jgi:hypothetical protein
MSLSDGAATVITVSAPGGGREFTWGSPESPLAKAQIGQSVKHNGRLWIVRERIERPQSLMLTLDPVE